MTDHFAQAAVLALAVGSVAFTMTRSKISSPYRVWLAKRAPRSKFWQWVFDLFACPYCLSHWLAFIAVAVYRPWIISRPFAETGWVAVQFTVTSLAVVAGAALTTLVIKKGIEK
jgi:hypothetical protein